MKGHTIKFILKSLFGFVRLVRFISQWCVKYYYYFFRWVDGTFKGKIIVVKEIIRTYYIPVVPGSSILKI